MNIVGQVRNSTLCHLFLFLLDVIQMFFASPVLWHMTLFLLVSYFCDRFHMSVACTTTYFYCRGMFLLPMPGMVTMTQSRISRLFLPFLYPISNFLFLFLLFNISSFVGHSILCHTTPYVLKIDDLTDSTSSLNNTVNPISTPSNSTSQ